MSTRASLAYWEGWHLYEELADPDPYGNLRLEVPRGLVEGGDLGTGSFVLRIPLSVWHVIRQESPYCEEYLSMTPDELRVEAGRWVDRRADYIKDHLDKQWAKLAGSLVADSDAPREEQIQQWLDYYTPGGTRATDVNSSSREV